MTDLIRIKQITYIVVGVLILGVLGFLVYGYLTPKTGKAPAEQQTITGRFFGAELQEEIIPSAPIPSELKTGESIEITSEQTLFRITDFPVVNPTLTSSGDGLLFYKKDGGDLYRSDFTGKNQEKLSNITVVGLMEAVWSPKGDRALVFYLDRETKKGFLHIGTSSVAVLPQDIHSAAWLSDGSSFVYTIRRNGQTDIVSADANGKNSRTIATTPLRDLYAVWAGRDTVMLQTPPSGIVEGYIFRLDRRTGTLIKFFGPRFGLASLWSPDGSRVLVSTTDRTGQNILLEIRNSAGAVVESLAMVTLPQKCVWKDVKEFYCAVPRVIGPQFVWPDEYLRGELSTDDTFAQLNLEKRSGETLFNAGDFDITEPLVTKTGEYLFFTHKRDGTLWAVKLK